MTGLRLLVGYALAFLAFAGFLITGVQGPLAILGVLLGFVGLVDAIVGWIVNTVFFGLVSTLLWVVARLILPQGEIEP